MQGVLFSVGRELMEKDSRDRTEAFRRVLLHSQNRHFSVRKPQASLSLCSPSEVSRPCRVNKVSEARSHTDIGSRARTTSLDTCLPRQGQG